jgi:hypothetical protein
MNTTGIAANTKGPTLCNDYRDPYRFDILTRWCGSFQEKKIALFCRFRDMLSELRRAWTKPFSMHGLRAWGAIPWLS